MGVGGQHHTPAAFTSGKHQYPLYRRKIAVLHHKCMGVPYRVNEALGDSVTPYLTVAWWVKSFRSGRVSTAYMYSSGCSVCSHRYVGHHNYTVYKDRHWTVKELAEHTGISSLYCSELFYLLINVPDCCQVSSTSFKLGATVGAL